MGKKRMKKCGLCSTVLHGEWAVRAHYCLKHGQSSRLVNNKKTLAIFTSSLTGLLNN